MRHRLCNISLVLSFLLYALSPLTYDLSARSTLLNKPPEANERVLHNASLYLIEILYEVFLDAHESEGESSPNRVIIKKKSSVQRGRYVLTTRSAGKAVFTAADTSFQGQFSISTEQAAVIRPWLRKNDYCQPLSSGLPPPLLS